MKYVLIFIKSYIFGFLLTYFAIDMWRLATGDLRPLRKKGVICSKLIKIEASDKDFLQNVCYIKHILLFLQPINNNYGKEYIWKDDAKGFDPAIAAHGRTDYAGTKAQASLYAGHCG